ncbi:MAG: hypothetical protein ACQEQI_03020 [Bacillota bacterium]
MHYDFVEQLETQVGDSVQVVITAGEGCCLHRGVLSQVGIDYLTLIDGEYRIEIPFTSIAALKQQTYGAGNDSYMD